MKWPEAIRPGAGPDVVSAIAGVAERSFFAMVDICDDERFAGLAAPHVEWLSASVRFEEPDCAGVLHCWMPASLAGRLFDAFTGRAPEEPAAGDDEMRDLVGEFANIICGVWLTRAANARTFVLRQPLVTRAPLSAAALARGLKVAIDEQPCVVEIAVDGVAQPAAD